MLSLPLPFLVESPFEFSGLTLLALLQGLTEFLPISSSGHLVLAQSAMGVDHPALALDVALHVGTLMAVVVVYRRDLWELVTGIFAGRIAEPALLVLGTLPAAIIGLAFKENLQAAFHDPDVAAWGLFVTAFILLVGEWARRRASTLAVATGVSDASGAASGADESPRMTWKQALVIGLFQAAAIVPGVSRSGSTIAAGLLCGLPAERAARFSFLLSIPAILGAAVLNLPDAIEQGVGGSVVHVVWAMGFAGFVGWGALRMLLAFLGRGAFAWFAAYCAVLGTGALILA